MHHAQHGIPELGLVIIDRVSARHHSTRLADLFRSSTQDLQQNLLRHLGGECSQIERHKGRGTHGVDIAQGVGGGDRPIVVGVVNNWREKVYRRHQCAVLAEPPRCGIIGEGQTHQQIWPKGFVEYVSQTARNSRQGRRGPLATSTGGLGQLRQPERTLRVKGR